MINQKIHKKLREVNLIISDVDGVLTDGKICIASNGDEMKNFCVEDGTGAALAKYGGIKIAFLSGRYSKATEIRAKELNIEQCFQGFLNKKDKFLEICKIFKEEPENVAYIGDGIIDIPVFEIAGIPISVPNGHDTVKKKSLLITEKCGGEGVLYEVIELILKSKNQYEEVINNMKAAVF